MSGEIILETRALTVGYLNKAVVSDISFQLHQGEILTLIGPNGAGKSTILKTITSELPCLSGEILLHGKQILSLTASEIAKQIAVLFTERISTERMTCFDVAAAGRYPYTGLLGLLSETDRAIVRDALQAVGMLSLADRDFRKISDGQRQSIMLARALAQQPDLLLLDEPTSYLDIGRKLDILTFLRSYVKEHQIAVIQSLHELDLAQKFSDLILCINGHHAVEAGTPEEIFQGDRISEIFAIQSGSYNPLFGSAEPIAVSGEPKVFVIGGGGSGIPLYRALYRAGIPFAAGVIHENDLDYPVCSALAAKVISEKPFEPISDDACQQAIRMIKTCETVICSNRTFGPMNAKNKYLCEYAEQCGKRKSTWK